jgi:hypothetical protein
MRTVVPAVSRGASRTFEDGAVVAIESLAVCESDSALPPQPPIRRIAATSAH